MPISEIGLLKLRPSQSIDDPELRRLLGEITAGLQDFTGYPFHFLQQVQDPGYIYLVGEWESLAQHYEGMHNSAVFKERLPVMVKFFEFQWMAHYSFEIDYSALESAESLGIARFMLQKGKQEEFGGQLGQIKDVLGLPTTEDGMRSGWKVDEKRDNDEYVFFWPCGSSKHGGGEEPSQTEGLVDEVDVRHARLLKFD